MDKSKQVIKNTKAEGQLSQSSDVANTSQHVENAQTQGAIHQNIGSQQTELSVGSYKAKGLIAVLALAVILIIIALVKYFGT